MKGNCKSQPKQYLQIAVDHATDEEIHGNILHDEDREHEKELGGKPIATILGSFPNQLFIALPLRRALWMRMPP